MEKKKLLLVAISVGIFLVIAIGAAIVFAPRSPAVPSGAVTDRGSETSITVLPPPSYQPPLSGPDTPTNGATESSQLTPVDAVDLVRKPGDVPGLKAPPEGTIRQGADYYVNGTTPSGSGKSPETLISVPKPSSAAVPDTPPAGKAAPAPAAPKPVAAAPAAPKPAAQKAPAKPAVKTNVYDDYWVQTGAFSTVVKAEGVKETLASKGISSIIENRDVEGKTLFRVRVGPYTSQNEADYWLSLVKSIDGFQDSQVRLTRRN